MARGDSRPPRPATPPLRGAASVIDLRSRRALADLVAEPRVPTGAGPDVRPQTLERLRMEAELRQAAATGALAVHVQPGFSLADGEPEGIELLVRWPTATGDVRPAADFLPLAEETELIVAVGAWVLDVACRQLDGWRGWTSGRPPRAWVNLAGRELRAEGLDVHLRRLAARWRVRPGELGLEVRHDVLHLLPPEALDRLRRVLNSGVALALDDVRTADLALPVGVRPVLVKIDRGVTAGLATSAASRARMAAVVERAHAVGARTHACGVEDSEQLRLARDLGCDAASGYLLSPPGPVEELAGRLAQGVATLRLLLDQELAGRPEV